MSEQANNHERAIDVPQDGDFVVPSVIANAPLPCFDNFEAPSDGDWVAAVSRRLGKTAIEQKAAERAEYPL